MRFFGDRLAARVAERESQIVLGLDPDPLALWPGIQVPSEGSGQARVAAMVQAHCRALIDAAGPACVAVKPQLARFELLGAPGWAALQATVEHAHARGLLAIADAKRGDIDVSARAYAQALMGTAQTPLGPLAGLGADMVTVNPLMGRDAIEPFVAVAREADAGLLVLVRTSNPGAGDIEDLTVAPVWQPAGERSPRHPEDSERAPRRPDGRQTRSPAHTAEAVWERIAGLVADMGSQGIGQAGLSDVGAVVGATAPRHLARARELMPHAIFLLPGVGAQGGRVEDLAPAFAPGRAGGLVTASRSIANAHLQSGAEPGHAARAEAERLRGLAWSLA